MSLRDLEVSARYVLPSRLLRVQFARAGGPGGQHVNKTSTKVDLRLDLEGASEFLGDENVARVRLALHNRLDANGDIQIISSEHREQKKNLDVAMVRLEGLIREALKPKKKRRPTKRTRGSQERRLSDKRRRADLKKGRSGIED